MDDILENHTYHFEYDGESLGCSIAQLSFYLEGKPDTPYWREGISNTGRPVPYNGRVYPDWALLDYYKLEKSKPELFALMHSEGGIAPCNLPPLGYVTYFLQSPSQSF